MGAPGSKTRKNRIRMRKVPRGARMTYIWPVLATTAVAPVKIARTMMPRAGAARISTVSSDSC